MYFNIKYFGFVSLVKSFLEKFNFVVHLPWNGANSLSQSKIFFRTCFTT